MRDEPSLISMHPFVRKFVLNIVRTIKEKNFGGEKFVIHADMVPKVSSNVMMASMGAGVVRPKLKERKKPVVVRRDMSVLAAPIEMPRRRAVPTMRSRHALPVRPPVAPPVQPKQVAPVVEPVVVEPVVVEPVVVEPVVVEPVVSAAPAVINVEGYGKIVPLLNDPSISTIECQGKGKELMIVRAGQNQRTRIVLGDVEINDLLEKIADEAHVPLIEGIFRASLPEFSVSAVVSKVVGSRFVIKKVTAYNLIS